MKSAGRAPIRTLPPDYPERVYAAVLGKLIGVYLGRPLRSFSTEFKLRLILRLQAGESGGALARENGIAPQLIYDWRKAYLA